MGAGRGEKLTWNSTFTMAMGGMGGGAYGYLRHSGAAGSLAWVLVAGYVLTISVYGFTFGHYLAVLGVLLGAASVFMAYEGFQRRRRRLDQAADRAMQRRVARAQESPGPVRSSGRTVRGRATSA